MTRTSVLLKTLIGVVALAVVASTPGLSSEAFATDDVFMDEGDGDFDAVPPIPAVDEAPAPAPAKKADKKKEKAAVAQPAPTPAEVALPEAPPTVIGDEDTLGADDPASHGGPVEPKAEAPKKAAKKTAKAEKKAPKKPSGDAGIFVHTKRPCPITREPAADSELIATTKAPRKIWVQEVDENWVRAYNKAGEPGFISRECLK